MSKDTDRINKFNEEVEELREIDCYAAVSKRFKEVIAEEHKEDNYFRIKNWYY